MVVGASACFRVVFSDGVREITTGVTIYSWLDYENFSLSLCRRFGISESQMIVRLIKWMDSNSSIKILITRKADFSAIVRERFSFFLVELTGARMSQRLFLLRRNQPELNIQLYQDQIAPPRSALYNERCQNLQIRRERDKMIMSAESNLNKYSSAGLNLDLLPRIAESLKVPRATANNKPTFCNECAEAREKGTTAPFHCCPYDVVVERFRSSAGPIARPRRACPEAPNM
ncbi:hypothetical protein NMG60_11020891 [Bertholletia excelsa]